MARLGFTGRPVELSLARDEARASGARCDGALLLPAVERRTEAATVPLRPAMADRLLDADPEVRLESRVFEVVVRLAVFLEVDGRRLAEAFGCFGDRAIATRVPSAGGEVERWMWFVRRASSID